jgi:putative copper resistance protein D
MSNKRVVFLSGLGVLLLVTWTVFLQAYAEEKSAPQEQQVTGEEKGTTPSSQEPLHSDSMRDGSEGSPGIEPQHQMTGLTMPEGHHHHRPSILPPDEDKAYSELNHHIAGVFVLFAGGLAMLAAFGGPRYSWARYGWPGLFFLLGVFLFFRHDPESWPWGPLSLWESITDAQVLQHTLFTFIVLGIGAIEWLRCNGTLTHPAWNWFFPILAISAAGMLFLHKHGEGVVADKIYLHHSIMATSGIIAMVTKVLDDSRLLKNRANGYLWPGLIMFIGVMLLIYSE